MNSTIIYRGRCQSCRGLKPIANDKADIVEAILDTGLACKCDDSYAVYKKVLAERTLELGNAVMILCDRRIEEAKELSARAAKLNSFSGIRRTKDDDAPDAAEY